MSGEQVDYRDFDEWEQRRDRENLDRQHKRFDEFAQFERDLKGENDGKGGRDHMGGTDGRDVRDGVRTGNAEDQERLARAGGAGDDERNAGGVPGGRVPQVPAVQLQDTATVKGKACWLCGLKEWKMVKFERRTEAGVSVTDIADVNCLSCGAEYSVKWTRWVR